MNNEEIMGCDTLSVLVLERNVGADANTEYTLPEYLPEIRKLLHVEQTVLPPAKYVNSSSAQMNGTVDYRVIYVGADGGLYTASVPAEYSVNIPIDMSDLVDSSEGLDIVCSVCGDSVSSRATGPRRLSIRGRLKCFVRVIGRIRLCESMIGDVDIMEIYKRREKCLTAECISSSSDVFEIECELSPISDKMRIADADAKVFVDSASVAQGKVNCRGEVIFRTLGTDEESGELMPSVKKIPFESAVELDSDISNAPVWVRGVPSDISVEVEEGRAICKVGVILEAKCFLDREVEYTADIYSTDRELIYDEREYESAQVLLCKNANVTLSERLSAVEVGISFNTEIVTVFAAATVDICKEEVGKYVFDGTAVFLIVCKEDGEYSCQELSLPFKYETEGNTDVRLTSFSGVADVISIRCCNGDNGISIDAELALGLDCFGSNRILAVCESEAGASVEKNTDSLIVCYPSGSDSVWSVAKRYKVAPSRISGDPSTDKYVIID